MWRIGLAFLCGHCCIHSLSALPSTWVIAPLAIACAIALACKSPTLAAFVLGVLWAWGYAHHRLENDLTPALEGRDLVVEGRIASILDTRDVDPQFEFDVLASAEKVPARLRLSWYDADLKLSPGERWRFVVRLKRRSGFANPGGFDYEGHLFRSGIGATGYIRDDSRNARIDDGAGHFRVLRVRAWLASRISLAVGDSRMLGILQGLAVGDTQAMLPQQWRVFAATGTSHLMAISGLHISMIAALAAWLGGSIVRIPKAQQWRITAVHGQALAGFAAALAYSLLAGMSVPTQRTLVMLGIYFAMRWFRRALNIGHALGLALIGVLVVDPFAPMSAGAWLSFGAVAVIVAATQGRLLKDGTIVGFARVQWAVTVGLVPILVIAFGGLSMISPLANAVAVPLFTLFLVPLTLIGTAATTVSLELGRWVLTAPVQTLEWCWPALAWLAEQPLAMWHLPELPMLHRFLLASGALLLLLPAVIPLRAAAIVLCLPALLFQPQRPGSGSFEFVLLDVGQGLAAVVITRSHVLVYDAGPAFRTGRDTGELVVVPYLRSRGVRAIDVLMVSHGDQDHAGGMQSVLASLPVQSLLLGPSVHADLPRSKTCVAGQRWRWDDVQFEVLHPQSNEAGASDNDSSCVLQVSGRGGTALLTGDIEADAEAALVGHGVARADLVTIAHHGSRTSSTAEFVAATRPTIALVAAGYRNRWNFPKQDVVDRWASSGANVTSTIDSGAVEVMVDAGGVLSVRRHRKERRRYWAAR